MMKKTKAPLGNWKTIRVRRKWLDLMHAVTRANPCPTSFVPYLDVENLNDADVVAIACELAAHQIGGKLFKDVAQKLYRWMDILQQNGAAQVAAHLGATIRTEPDGTYTIVKARGREIPLPPLPRPELPAEMFIH